MKRIVTERGINYLGETRIFWNGSIIRPHVTIEVKHSVYSDGTIIYYGQGRRLRCILSNGEIKDEPNC